MRTLEEMLTPEAIENYRNEYLLDRCPHDADRRENPVIQRWATDYAHDAIRRDFLFALCAEIAAELGPDWHAAEPYLYNADDLRIAIVRRHVLLTNGQLCINANFVHGSEHKRIYFHNSLPLDLRIFHNRFRDADAKASFSITRDPKAIAKRIAKEVVPAATRGRAEALKRKIDGHDGRIAALRACTMLEAEGARTSQRDPESHHATAQLSISNVDLDMQIQRERITVKFTADADAVIAIIAALRQHHAPEEN